MRTGRAFPTTFGGMLISGSRMDPIVGGAVRLLKNRTRRLNKDAHYHQNHGSEQEECLGTSDDSILDVYMAHGTSENKSNALISRLRTYASPHPN